MKSNLVNTELVELNEVREVAKILKASKITFVRGCHIPSLVHLCTENNFTKVSGAFLSLAAEVVQLRAENAALEDKVDAMRLGPYWARAPHD
jgi:hypothetical protein